MKSSVDEIKAAMAVTEQFWDEYTHQDRNHMFWHVFHAIVLLVKESPSLEAGKTEECYFTSSELAEKTAYLSSKKLSIFSSSRLNSEFKILTQRLDELYPSLERVASELGVDVIPAIHKESNSGGQGKQSIYRLCVNKIEPNKTQNTVKKSTDEVLTSSDVIDYHLESLPKLPVWTRWLHNVDMDKHRWKILLFTASPVILVVLCSASFYLSLAELMTPNFLGTLLGLTAIYVTIFLLFFRYLIDALNNNITTLPDIMLPLSLKSALLHYELKEPGSKEGRLKRLTIKVYKAKCPICGYRVDIKSIGLPFRSRLIGICDNNPLEHRYSFDFTTKKGSKLI
ncbi:hypothetical protein [Vibrio bivalvicida]|uniref:Uncharacterized protein n=1 Tax=Vibrio bivalvicida TaxID=1276888 RepID=A0A177Y546_9VIBR|nr:hypothetical protein [Vibrio bivalvicida]OAJ95897.1 hypothetical protein APB76_02030 [Vibrio bivalvicida]